MPTHFVAISLLLMSGALSSRCTVAMEIQEVSGQTMGTTYTFRISVPAGKGLRPETRGRIEGYLAEVDDAMSTYKPASDVSRLNSAPVSMPVRVSTRTVEVLAAAKRIAEDTEGAFDPTVGALVDIWGFGPPGMPQSPPSADSIARARQNMGYPRLAVGLDPPTATRGSDFRVDLSGIAKGFAVDLVADGLLDAGYKDFAVEIGGEARVHGRRPDGDYWRIAVDSPRGDGNYPRMLRLDRHAVATSGDYRRYYEKNGVRYTHIIDPVTGYPIAHKLAAVTVVTGRDMEADALATALMVMGEEKGLAFAQKQNLTVYMLIRSGDGFTERMTPGFRAILATEPDN